MITTQIILAGYLGLGILSVFALCMCQGDCRLDQRENLFGRLRLAGEFLGLAVLLSLLWPGIWYIVVTEHVPGECRQFLSWYAVALAWCATVALAYLSVAGGWA